MAAAAFAGTMSFAEKGALVPEDQLMYVHKKQMVRLSTSARRYRRPWAMACGVEVLTYDAATAVFLSLAAAFFTSDFAAS